MRLTRSLLTSRIARRIRQLGPYAAIELILPGGSLIALALWALRRPAWVLITHTPPPSIHAALTPDQTLVRAWPSAREMG